MGEQEDGLDKMRQRLTEENLHPDEFDEIKRRIQTIESMTKK